MNLIDQTKKTSDDMRYVWDVQFLNIHDNINNSQEVDKNNLKIYTYYYYYYYYYYYCFFLFYKNI